MMRLGFDLSLISKNAKNRIEIRSVPKILIKKLTIIRELYIFVHNLLAEQLRVFLINSIHEMKIF